jgi:hypothetical protein
MPREPDRRAGETPGRRPSHFLPEVIGVLVQIFLVALFFIAMGFRC